MGSMKQALRILFARKHPDKVEAAKESIRVVALKRERDTLNGILVNYEVRIADLMDENDRLHKEKKDTSMEDRLVGLAENFFLGGNQPKTIQTPPTQSNNSVPQISQNKTEEELKFIVSQFTSDTKKIIANTSEEKFLSHGAKKFPDLTKEDLLQGYKLIKEEVQHSA